MRTLICFLLLLGLSATVRAQGSGAIFVEGAVFGDHDPTHRTELSMTTGAGGTIGFRLNERFSVRFDAEAPNWHGQTNSTYLPGVFMSNEANAFRTITYGALFGGHAQPYRNVDMAFLAGLSSAVPESRGSGFSETLAKDGSVVHREDFTSHYSYLSGALTLGVDVAVRVTSHLSLVPELRFHAYSEYGTIVRPKVAVRWTF